MSNVTGHNLELLYSFLNLVPSVNSAAEQEKLEQEALEFQVGYQAIFSKTFYVIWLRSTRPFLFPKRER